MFKILIFLVNGHFYCPFLRAFLNLLSSRSFRLVGKLSKIFLFNNAVCEKGGTSVSSLSGNLVSKE